MALIRKTILLASTTLSIGLAAPAFAQTAPADRAAAAESDIIVTARRVEERLQDVPISITVISQQQLSNNNIQSAKDIATYTPSLVTNNRYGSDNTTWTIRGFTQEQRTTSTVGTYFADVVAPRGSGATQGGDGAGPGALFDLNSVQVLNGPQGTLFGRNSTGGAVLLVPKKPTDNLEGYVEGSLGSYNLRRVQAVVNIPFGDSFRVRVGGDLNKRNGYLKNVGLIGGGPYGPDLGSVDYAALRVSAVADLSPDIENYTIVTYSRSNSSGVIPKITQCYSLVTCQQKAREDAVGTFTVSSALPDQQSVSEQWQVINTTTWNASDALTVKNIFSYGEFRGTTNLELFGQYQPIVTPGTETNGLQVRLFNSTHALPGAYTNAESSLVEELQFQGRSGNNKLTWQGGLYLEVNSPLGLSGIQSTTFTPCANVSTMNCLPFAGGGATSLGRLSYSATRNSFLGKAAYFQASYDLTEKLKLTGGIRYTEDKMQSQFQVIDIRLGNTIVASPASPKIYDGTVLTANTVRDWVVCTNTPTFGAQGSAGNPYMPVSQRFTMCQQDHTVKTSAPTWLVGLDYKPIENVLLYAKYSRGYRQGGVASFAADKLQDYKAEKVDTYEIGAKTSWRGMFPGHFNIAGYYNDFGDQQLQIGLQCNPVANCSQTTAIINAGKSRLSGFETELGVSPFRGLNLLVSYAHLSTKVLSVADVVPLVVAAGLPYNDIRPIAVGSVLPNSIPDKVVASGSYTLPLPESIGKLSFGVTWVWQSAYRAVADNASATFSTLYYNSTTPFASAQAISTVGNGILPKANYGNINVNWENVGGLPVDAAFFMTNVTNARVLLHANTQETSGLVSNIIGEPRMYGVRVKVRFGG